MKYSILVFIILLFAICKVGFSQSNPRMQNENYMRTVFLENFSAGNLDRDIWLVENNYKRGLGLLVDNPLTLKLNSGNLELSMLYRPGSTTANYTGDYIGAEIISKTPYQYGSFECNAKYAQLNSSWPAFWIIGGDGTLCPPGGYGNEIDIAELMCKTSNLTIDHIIHRYYPTSDCSISNHDQKDAAYTQNILNNSYHTYKCIWSPTKIDYYIDGSLKHTVINTGQEWYPSLFLQVRLSQQIVDPIGSPVAPQTSYFDYVKVRQFFLAPEITLSSNIICSSGTATMNVATEATNITWALTPSNLFSGATTGTGKIANITRATSANGKGKITYTFQMPITMAPYYETFTAEKEVWIGGPVIQSITGPLYTPNNQWATYHAELVSGLSAATSYNWTLNPLNGNSLYYNGSSTIDIAFYNPGTYQLIVQAKNACTGAGYGPYFVTGLYVYNTRSLSISPNPTNGETTLELMSDSKEVLVEDPEWSVEIYDSMQSLKEKETKIKSKQIKISTSGWREGVYFIRAKIGDEIINSKMMVKP